MNPTAKPTLAEETLIAVAWDKCSLSHPTGSNAILINPLTFNGVNDQINSKINLKSFPTIILTSVLFPRWVANIALGQKTITVKSTRITLSNTQKKIRKYHQCSFLIVVEHLALSQSLLSAALKFST